MRDVARTTADGYTPAADYDADRLQWRCYHCRRLLGTVLVRSGWAQIEVRCRGCQTVNVLTITSSGVLPSPPDDPAL